MPLYMDMHKKIKGVSAKAVAEAHRKDLEHQGKHGVQFLKYWVDVESESVFCLVNAPDSRAPNMVHKEAHGLLADEIHEVTEGK
ncbi:MAG: DUF4242 domain-containing protein [Nitrososphaerales archaeon]|nr:DUF4242 domain-containing protein [Nitrososphaerales archaeon]